MKFRDQQNAFTLIELLVAISVIGVLIAISVPAVQSVREAARRGHCQNRIRQLALATINYESATSRFPASHLDGLPQEGEYSTDQSCFVELLPYLELASLFDQYNANSPVFSATNQKVVEAELALLQCPSSLGSKRLENLGEYYDGPPVTGRFSTTFDFRGCGGFFELPTDSPFQLDGPRKVGPLGLQIKGSHHQQRINDGRSNTILFWESAGKDWYVRTGGETIQYDWQRVFDVGEITSVAGTENEGPFLKTSSLGSAGYFFAWAGFGSSRAAAWDSSGLVPGSPYESPNTFQRVIGATNKFGQAFSFHPNGCNIARADGSIEFVSNNVDAQLFFAMSASSDGSR